MSFLWYSMGWASSGAISTASLIFQIRAKTATALQRGWGSLLQAGAHERLAFVALERLGGGLGVAGGHLLLLRGGSETMGRDGHGQYEHRDTQDIHRTLLEGLHVRMQVR